MRRRVRLLLMGAVALLAFAAVQVVAKPHTEPVTKPVNAAYISAKDAAAITFNNKPFLEKARTIKEALREAAFVGEFEGVNALDPSNSR